MNSVSFPTQGEVIQFVFDALGIMPRKHEDDSSFDQTRKKSTQKALQRLAKEEGVLDQRLGEMIQTLSYLVAGSIPPRESLALGDMLCDLLDIYRDTLRSEGTFLTKSETVKWILLDRIVPRLPISVAKHLQRYNVAADSLIVPPDTYWYLPSKEADGWIWPLEKVMRWAYELAGTSIKNFHRAEYCETQEKNLESAKKWLADIHIPSWPALLENFNQSFVALGRGQDKQELLALSDTQKVSIRMALFVARASTYISKEVLIHLGKTALDEACSRYQIIADCVEDDKQRVSRSVQQIIFRNGIASNEWDELWFDISTDYWVQFADRQYRVMQGLKHNQISEVQAMEMLRSLGRLAVLPFEKTGIFKLPHSILPGFSKAVLDGLALRKSPEINTEKIEAYARNLDDQSLRRVLEWMIPWQMATYHYRAERYEAAYPFIKDAFEKAQYCAGANQYLLVNQYIELAAKNDKWRDFKRGIQWAAYLGIEIRWLRKDEPTQENLQFVFEIMKKAVYAV